MTKWTDETSSKQRHPTLRIVVMVCADICLTHIKPSEEACTDDSLGLSFLTSKRDNFNELVYANELCANEMRYAKELMYINELIHYMIDVCECIMYANELLYVKHLDRHSAPSPREEFSNINAESEIQVISG